jgi:hypothetical protein
MSFGRGRHAAGRGERPVSVGDRRVFLSKLDEVVRSSSGLACGIVTRGGVPVLHVINAEMPRYAAEIGADFIEGGWWYTWVVSGGAIGPVDDPGGVAEAVARALKADGQTRW